MLPGVKVSREKQMWKRRGGRRKQLVHNRYDPVNSKHFQCARTTGLVALYSCPCSLASVPFLPQQHAGEG